jgi:hypothetical protein
MSWYAKQNSAWAQVINPSVKSSTSWSSVDEGWVRSQGTWQRFYYRDYTAPAPPEINLTEVSTGIQVEAIVPALSNAVEIDLRGEVIAGEIDQLNNTFWQVQGVIPGETVTYLWEVPVTPGTTYQVEGRLLSNTGISSIVATDTLGIPPTVNYYKAYIDPVGSDSWINGSGWDTTDNQVVQGGGNNLHRGVGCITPGLIS